MSESVEQAALAGTSFWQGRARREASAILDECSPVFITSRADLVRLLSIAWLQGVNLGSHETLAAAEVAFERVKDSL